MARNRMMILAALAPLALLSTPAHAVSDVAVVVGTGSISPGLPTTGCADQHVEFDGTAVNAGDHAGVYTVSFNGDSSICETLNAGEGSGTLSGDVSGTVNYTRTGPYVSITGSGELNGAGHTIVRGDCVFVPVGAAPVSSYALYCHVVLDPA